MIRRTYKNRDSLIPTVQTVVSILNDKINFLDTSLSDYGNKDGKGDINGDINDNINDNYTRYDSILVFNSHRIQSSYSIIIFNTHHIQSFSFIFTYATPLRTPFLRLTEYAQ